MKRMALVFNALLLTMSVISIGTLAAERHEQTFAASDGSFRFSYPSNFQICTKGEIDPCIHSFIPACQDDPLVCVVYPAQAFKDTNFEAASVQVREIFVKAKYANLTADYS